MLLDAFHNAKSSLSLSDLAQRTGLYKSTILRLVRHRWSSIATCTAWNRGASFSAARLFELGNAYRRTFRLIDLVRPVLERLAGQGAGERFVLGARGRPPRLPVRVESSQNVRDAMFREGDRRQLDKGPTSTLLQAFSGAKGKRFDEVRREVAAVSIGLYRPDIAGIACPAFGARRACWPAR